MISGQSALLEKRLNHQVFILYQWRSCQEPARKRLVKSMQNNNVFWVWAPLIKTLYSPEQVLISLEAPDKVLISCHAANEAKPVKPPVIFGVTAYKSKQYKFSFCLSQFFSFWIDAYTWEFCDNHSLIWNGSLSSTWFSLVAPDLRTCSCLAGLKLKTGPNCATCTSSIVILLFVLPVLK